MKATANQKQKRDVDIVVKKLITNVKKRKSKFNWFFFMIVCIGDIIGERTFICIYLKIYIYMLNQIIA